MPTSTSASSLIEQHREKLELEWVAGETGAHRTLNSGKQNEFHPLIGHLNPVRPNLIQIIDRFELDYLNQLDKQTRKHFLGEIFDARPFMVMVVNRHPVPPDLKELSEATQTPLLTTPQASNQLIDYLRYHLRELVEDAVTLHGVFMEVLGIGVLLEGLSGIGKSELALELITRGHRLIADDAPSFISDRPGIITGACPLLLTDFLEVRGLGVLNVRAMFGDGSVLDSRRLDLIIRLEPGEQSQLSEFDRLDGGKRMAKVLEIEIPQLVLPVAPGRNLAVIVEAAVRNHLLNLNGYDASRDFVNRQRALMETKNK